MPEMFLALVLFAVVATLTPGGATTLATASGARFGFRRSIPLLAGIAFGLASLAAAASAGLATLLQAAPVLQLAMKLLGSAYLSWLAWTIGTSGSPQAGSRAPSDAAAAPTGFWAGLLLLWLNPKGWAMALGAATSFAALAADPLHLALLLGATFGAAAVASLSLWCVGGFLLARALRTERQWRAVNAVLGLLLFLSIVPMWLG
ncbi:LysE family translocator [Arenibaculum sp.]|jgi:threonine/homoserine/homoserine lactone efflux protein|uniref:LysE family translocator n=1 Tax=Arenibaculum sp. TaxID=2865862 RepID=UPI002E14D399|nr:LysE family translocator [Arenibaculum sp.]